MTKDGMRGRGASSPVEGGHRPTGTGDEARKPPKRFWAKHKTEAVLRLLRGEDIEILSRELGVTAAALTRWRDQFLAGGAEGLKKRSPK
ncbi:helix-turn-helix domain-containing protein, partial [Desulfocurvus vexinensis]